MMLTRFASQILNTIRPATSAATCSSWSIGLFQQAGKSIESIAGGTWGIISVRTNVRCHFPRAKEVKRVRRHGYKTRMASPSGREILMRRILKGRFVLSH